MDSRTPPSKILKFGLYELDLQTQQLRRSGVPLRIQPQPFKVLSVLASAKGGIVTREQLQRELWGNETYVDFGQGLNYCIAHIRAILSDEAHTPRYIETVPRVGYRFIEAVSNGEPSKPEFTRTAETVRTSFQRRILKILLASTVLFGLTASVAYVWKMRATHHLSEQDTIVLLDFANTTGDPAFDRTLREALSVQLEQSPFLNLLSDQRTRETLKLMTLPEDTPLSLEVGLQVCQRTDSAAVIAGMIQSVGTPYSVTLESSDCRTGASLGRAQVQAARKEDVLKALGSASTILREKLGESLSSIQKFDKPIEQVTTPSLEALRYFTLGYETYKHEGAFASIPNFKRAIELDPNFALAHAKLANEYGNLGETGAAEVEIKKALSLSEHVSEREKLYLTAHYYDMLGQLDLEIQTYEAYCHLYPRDFIPHGNLTWKYEILGRFDKALEHGKEAFRLAPDVGDVASELARTYAGLGRLEEARAVLIEARSHTPDSWVLHLDMSNIALALGDSAAREQEDDALKATPEGTLNLLYRDAALAASRGQLQSSQELYAQIRQLGLKLQLKDNPATAMALQAEYESYLREPSQAKKSAMAALRMTEIYDVTAPPVAIALATAGEEERANAVIQRYAKRYPDDTLNQFVWAPTVRAITSLNHGKAEEAIQALSLAVPYDRAILDSRMARANALLAAKRAEAALDEYQIIVNLRTRFPEQPAWPLARLGMARAYALAGDRSRSRDAYEEFLTLWKDADSSNTILNEAKAEFSKLH